MCDESGLKFSAFYLRGIVNRAVWNQIKQVTAFSKTSNSLYRAQPGTEIASKIKSTLVVDKTIRSKNGSVSLSLAIAVGFVAKQ